MRRHRRLDPVVSLGILLGTVTSRIGWFLFGFGMIFFWAFALNADLSYFTFPSGKVVQTSGTVTGNRKTSFSEGGSKHRKGTPIYETRYQFQTPDGRVWEGSSYAKGRSINKGKTVSIEYLSSSPSSSRIKGMRTKPLGIFVLFVLIFPAVGVLLIFLGIKDGLQKVSILQSGILAKGKVIKKDPTSMKVNKKTVYRYTIHFEDQMGNIKETSYRTHQTSDLDDQSELQFLYDPKNEQKILLLDLLPGSVELSPGGSLRSKSFIVTIINLLFPAIVLGGHAAYFYFRFLT